MFKKLLKLLLILTIISSFCIAILSYLIDKRVSKYLKNRNINLSSAILTDSIRLRDSNKINAKSFEDLLKNLDYNLVSKPSGPGEFNHNDGLFELITHPFTYYDGETQLSTAIRYDTSMLEP